MESRSFTVKKIYHKEITLQYYATVGYTVGYHCSPIKTDNIATEHHFLTLVADFKVHRYQKIVSNPLPRWFHPVIKNQGKSDMVKREVPSN